MATHANTPSTPSRRRALFGGAAAVVLGSGITAGAAASVADLVPSSPDAELLALRPRLDIAVRDVGYSETSNWPPGMTNAENEDWVSQTAQELEDACRAIVDAPAAQTAEGRALKCAAAMHHLKFSYCGRWPGAGEANAWDVLSELAGDAYVAPLLPERVRHLCEPGRA